MFGISLTGNLPAGQQETINREIGQLTDFIGRPLIGSINRKLSTYFQHKSSFYELYHTPMLPAMFLTHGTSLAGEGEAMAGWVEGVTDVVRSLVVHRCC